MNGINARDYDAWLERNVHEEEELEEQFWDSEMCAEAFQEWERDCYPEFGRTSSAWETWQTTHHYSDVLAEFVDAWEETQRMLEADLEGEPDEV